MSDKEYPKDLPSLREALEGNIIPNGLTASSMVHDMDLNFENVFLSTWVRIEEEYDRRPPYDPDKLKKLNQSYRVNVNIGEMEAIISEAVAGATETVFSTKSLVDLHLRTYLPGAEVQSTNYEAVVAEEYSETLNDALGFFSFVDSAHSNTMLFGFSAALWPNEYDWRPIQPDLDRFRFPAQCPVKVEDVPYFAVHRGIPLHEIFDKALKEDSATWNVPLLRRALIDRFEGELPSTEANRKFAELRVRWERGDPGLRSQSFSDLPVTDLYLTDPVTGDVTHLILWEGPQTRDESASGEEDRASGLSEREVEAIEATVEEGHILFARTSRYKSMSHALWLMTFDQGRKTLDSVKGLGRRVYSHTSLSNRLFCQTVDGAVQAASLVLVPPEAGSASKVPFTRVGPFTALSSGWSIPSNNFNPPINHLISLRSMNSGVLHNNIGNYRRRSEDPMARSGTRSATEIQAEMSHESESEQGRAMYRFQAWDKFHREVFRRLTCLKLVAAGLPGEDDEEKTKSLSDWIEQRNLESHPDDDEYLDGVPGGSRPGRNEALRFLGRCAARGVPVSVILLGRWQVQASRGVGIASRASRMQALQTMMELRQEMPPDRRRQVAREIAAQATMNDAVAMRFFPPLETGEYVSQTASLVQIENAMMKKGEYIPAAADQPHEEHMSILMSSMAEAAQEWQQNPQREALVELSTFLQMGLKHAQDHLQYLAQDPFYKDQTENFTKGIQQFAAATSQLVTMGQQVIAEKEQEAQRIAEENEALRQQVAEQNSKFNLAMREIEADERVDMAKTESLNRSREAKTATQLQTRNAEFQQKMQREMQKHQVEMAKALDELNAMRQKLSLELQKLQSETQQTE